MQAHSNHFYVVFVLFAVAPALRLQRRPNVNNPSSILSEYEEVVKEQRWYRDRVAIRDTDMPAYASMNNFSNVCVVPQTQGNDPSQNDLFFVGDASRNHQPCETLEPNWNGGEQDCGMVWFRHVNPPEKANELQQKWNSEPTLAIPLLSNPAHSVADVLWSLYPRFHETDPFTLLWLPSDASCTSWLCDKLKEFYLLKRGRPIALLNETSTTCFSKLYIPQLTRWRWTPDSVPDLNVSLAFRDHLTKSFSAPQKNVLLYGHEDGNGRKWKNIQEIHHFLQGQSYHVRRISNMSALSPKEQCRVFWDADFILASHGGHMGNHMCARNGTRLVEFSCDVVGWFAEAKRLHQIMGFTWSSYLVPVERCVHHGSNPFFWDFDVPEEAISKLLSA